MTERSETARGRLRRPAIQLRTVSRQAGIAALALVGILAHLILRFSPIAPGIPPDLPLWLVLALGGTVGVIFGVYPARRAARLDPITALRAE